MNQKYFPKSCYIYNVWEIRLGENRCVIINIISRKWSVSRQFFLEDSSLLGVIFDLAVRSAWNLANQLKLAKLWALWRMCTLNLFDLKQHFWIITKPEVVSFGGWKIMWSPGVAYLEGRI